MDKNKVYKYTQINETATIVEKAGADIDDVRCRLVKYDANGDVILCAAGEAPLGVAIITNASEHKKGQDVDVQIRYNGLVMAGAAVAKGDVLASDAGGKAVKATSGATIGIALESAAKADDLIRFIMVHGVASEATGE